MTETLEKNRSRFKGSGKAILPHMLTEQDAELLKALFYDRFLSADYLAKLIGSSYKGWMLDRVADLRSEPHAYIKICDRQLEARSLYMNVKLQYELTERGMKVLLDRFGLEANRRRVKFFEHHIMGDHAMASLRIGCNASSGRFELLGRDALLNHPNMPESTRKRQFPDYIPLPDIKGVKRGEHAIRPDREMFVVRDTETNKAFFFPGFEVGTGSETHSPKDGRHDHSYTESKFVDYLTILKERIYRSYFGSPNFYIMFLEPNWNRIKLHMMPLLARLTKNEPQFRKNFLFGVQHAFTDIYEANGDRLTGDYWVVGDGGKPATFNFLKGDVL